jgi:hypothetical protein
MADSAFRARGAAAAARSGLGLGTYLSGAVRRFLDRAGDEDWLRIMGAMERADDPGQAALRVILRGAVTGTTEVKA